MIDITEQRLTAMRERLEVLLEQMQSEDGALVALTEEELERVIAAMKEASQTITYFVNR